MDTESVADPVRRYIDWCQARPGRSRFVDGVRGRTHYLEWEGPSGAGTLVLVHGFMGHAHWWDFVAPSLAEDYRVVALDLGGMGDSEIEPPYSLDGYVAQIAEFIRAVATVPVSLIGHSFGGRCTILTAHANPAALDRAIAIDSHVSFPNAQAPRATERPPPRASTSYADIATALARFRLVPEEPGTHPRILEHVGTHALKNVAEGWTWKFDPAILVRGPKPAISDARALPLLQVRLDFICGQWSKVVSPEHALEIAKAIPSGLAPIVIPGGYHHLPIGQPIALTAVLRSLLKDVSVPRGRESQSDCPQAR